MANYSLLIHPITSLPPNREPTEGWPWLSSWTVSITWPRPFRGGPHGDSWPFFPHFFSDFLAGKFDCLNITRKLEVSLYGLSLINVATCFFSGMMFFLQSSMLFASFISWKISSSRTRISDSPSAPVCDFRNSGRPLMIHKHQIRSILIAVWPYKVWRLRNLWPNWQFGWLAGWCV